MSRSQPADSADSPRNPAQQICLFPSEIGWMAIVGQGNSIRSISVGYSTAALAKKAILQSLENDDSRRLKESDWNPLLREELQAYAQGQRIHFSEYELQLPPRTAFRDKVLAATQRLEYGQTTTYGDLARIVGHPRAARAVGTVMSTNRFPILIPCHRVLASGGKLGGYSSPAGIGLKQLLLDLEQSA